LAACLATSPSDRSYGLAVNRVIELVWDAELLSPAVQRFLDDYVSRYGSRRAQDVDWASLYALGRLFEFHDRLEAAKRAYRALLSGNPQFADAATRLDHVEEGRAETSDGAWQPVHELIDGLHEFAPLPQFDAMPPLGVAPAGRAVAAPPPRRTPDSLSTDETRDVPAQRLSAASQTPSRARSTGDETVDFDEYVARRPDVAAISGGVMSHSSDELPPPRRARTSTSSEGWVSGEESAPRRTPGDGGAGEDVLSPGTVIANRYRVEGVVGSGGMATVYRATDLELEEVVALKVFQQVVQNRSRLERFRREMKLSRKLVHPNVVRIYEFGTWRGVRFITMELLVGDDLEVHLRKADGPLSVSEALRLMIQACEGLGAAHEQGVIHRDIKPQNLFVTEGGKRLKIMDFGIAKVTNSASVSVTGVRVGTPRYMAPEQIQGGVDVGPAADIYALGGVMYELLTGTPVFQEEDLVPLLLSHMTEEPEPPSRRNAKVPRDAEEIVLKLLRKNPEERFADCGELKKALVRAFIASQRA
jgi:serine/threonine-protein kinase